MDDEREYVKKVIKRLQDENISIPGYPENREQLIFWLEFVKTALFDKIKEMERKIKILDNIIIKLKNETSTLSK